MNRDVRDRSHLSLSGETRDTIQRLDPPAVKSPQKKLMEETEKRFYTRRRD